MLLLEGFARRCSPVYLLYALGGVFVGTAVGVLPGIGPAMTVALLLPITYALDPAAALIVFAGIYYGGMYGGSTTSILLNTPGESSSIVTALEGNKMAKAGGARRPWRRRRSDPSSPAPSPRSCWPSWRPSSPTSPSASAPVDYLALMVRGLPDRRRAAGRLRRCAAWPRLPRAVHRPDRHR